MAKKQRLTKASDSKDDAQRESSLFSVLAAAIGRFGIAVLIVATLLMPCDSTAVEQGSATYLSLLTIPVMTLAFFVWPSGPKQGRRSEFLLLTFVAWIGIATAAVPGLGNLRHAVNEFWVWLGIFAAYASARRLIATPAQKQCLIIVLLAALTMLAIHNVHQKFVSIPATIRQYESDPELGLRNAGIEAPEGSAIRFQYEGRLYAAESMATFSLSTSAAVILLFGFTTSLVYLLLVSRLPNSGQQILIASVAAVLFLIGILTTGSRTVTGLLIIVVVLTLTNRFIFTRQAWTQVTRNLPMLSVAIAIGVTGIGAMITHWPSLLDRFPLSIQFRFQYWASSFRMLADHPWLGVGPGNFQSSYAQFKAASMSEMIADPHNMTLESATAGGVPAGLLCLAMLGILASEFRRKKNVASRDVLNDSSQDSKSGIETHCDFAIAGGALAAMAGVWSLGLTVGVAPDLDPYLISLPIAIAFVWFFTNVTATYNQLACAVWVGCFTLFTSLLFSGGWTTPGIAIPIWCLLGTIVAKEFPETPSTKNARIISTLCGLALFAFFSTTTLTPILSSIALSQLASDRFSEGNPRRGTSLLEQAVDADRWNPGYARQMVAVRTDELLQFESEETRQKWRSSVKPLLRRDPRNPRVYQQLGDAQLQIYQRWGRQEDLEAAASYYALALQMDPTNIQLTAQAAVVADGLDLKDESRIYWTRTLELSKVNQNTESKWELLYVLPAERSDSQIGIAKSITIKQAWANRNANEPVITH